MNDMEEIALDRAYLAGHVCTIITELGIQGAIIKSKKNTMARSRGSSAWRRRVLACNSLAEEQEGKDVEEVGLRVRHSVQRRKCGHEPTQADLKCSGPLRKF